MANRLGSILFDTSKSVGTMLYSKRPVRVPREDKLNE